MKFRTLLGIYALVTLVTVMIYATAQQIVRIGANTLPATSAHFLADQFSRGATADALISTYPEPLPPSGASFSLVADTSGKTQISTYMLDGKPLTLPKGVFDAALQKGDNRITWQPTPTIREAIVVVPYTTPVGKKGFVVSGVSLKEPEATISGLTPILGFGWIAMILVASVFFFPLKSKK